MSKSKKYSTINQFGFPTDICMRAMTRTMTSTFIGLILIGATCPLINGNKNSTPLTSIYFKIYNYIGTTCPLKSMMTKELNTSDIS
jgi:hypothetical protein